MLADAMPDWLEAVVIVAFHVEHGQVIEDIYSLNGVLGEHAKRNICSLSLPDSNSGQNGDVQFAFRYRRDAGPLLAPSGCAAPVHEFSYCSAFFRQIKDPSFKRGYFQKSVVLVSRAPLTTFLEECSFIVGPLFFEFGRSVLEAILQNIKGWPAPVPGKHYRLPLAGCLIDVTVPRVHEDARAQLRDLFSAESEAQQQQHHQHESHGGLWSPSSAFAREPDSGFKSPPPTGADGAGGGGTAQEGFKSARRDGPKSAAGKSPTPSSSSVGFRSPGGGSAASLARPKRSFVFESSGGGHILKQQELLHRLSSEPSPPLSDLPDSPRSAASSLADDEDLLRLNEFERIAAEREQRERAQRRSERRAGASPGSGATGGSGSSQSSSSGGGGGGGGSQSSAFGSQGSSHSAGAYLFGSERVLGLFQEVPLFSTFGGLSVALWHVWELALAGQPVLVLAPTPDRCSQAVLAIASLIAPIQYCGDYRPYFTIYDPDFMEISKRHDEMRGANVPSCVLGVTNPYFLKSLEYWPNVISMGGHGPSTTALARSLTPPPKLPGEEGAGVKSSSDPPSPQQKAKPVPLSRGSSSETYERIVFESLRRATVPSSTLQDLGRTSDSLSVQGDNIKSARYVPTVAKRGDSLRALLTDQKYERSIILTRDDPIVPPDMHVLRQLLNEHDAAKASVGLSTPAEPPALAINNALLRQHFQRLTKAFLRPLEAHVRLEAVGSRAARQQGFSVSAYDDGAAGRRLQHTFDVDQFFAELEAAGPPRELQRSDWRRLYGAFIEGPNFATWLAQQRAKLAAQLSYIYRHLRLNTDPDVLLRTAGSAPGAGAGLLTAAGGSQSTASSSAANAATTTTIGAIGGSISMRLPGAPRAGGTSPKSARAGSPKSGCAADHPMDVLARVQRALDDEMAKDEAERDAPLVARIKEHLAAVESLLSRSC
jgi:hypothetical protein